ncbi:MAG TPA: hypothetical protein DIC52_14605 [Candidatus Latescibacteria bacterium]|nr:hypothetical protein [Candidatus Latescibacterota bacterium]|tara:strand:- start:580 stop:1278 length:699 start_codon:yes stop_codon:yes gene_type:complete
MKPRRAMTVVVVLLMGCTGDTIVRTAADNSESVQVSGTASVQVTPNVAATTIGVQTFEADAVVAVTVNNERVAAVITSLEGLGVLPQDLQTSGFSISPQRAYAEDRPDSITGFWVRNSISATVRDLTTVGAILQGAIEAGANEIHGLQFTVSNPDSIEDVARRLAVQDARRRAESLADAAGASVGRVLSLSESSVAVPSIFRGVAELDAAAVPVQPGEVDVTAFVTAVFALK